jgi:hypothetical protein
MKKTTFVLLGAASLVCTGGTHAQSSATPPVVGDVVVSGSALSEEKPDGANGEPEWVRQRRFSNTRVYVQQDPWEFGAEEWWRTRFYDGGHVTQRLQNEIELGLPHRMQLDLYENILHDNTISGWQQEEVAVELRYAFADWNVIPGNPTLYLEYSFAHSGSDALEPKLLFGGEFRNGWHWGLNLICEQELWGAQSTEKAVAGGISRTLVDDKLSVGIEGNWSAVTREKSEMILGPSVQWRPTHNTHLDLVAMAGLTNSSPNAECWMIFGFDFGDGKVKNQGYKPTSLGGH